MKLRTTVTLLTCLALWPQAAVAREFYADPVNGDMRNDGSAAAPWGAIGQVIEAGLVESQQWASLPYQQGAQLVPRNAGAPVKPGDTIWLRSGYHGDLVIEGHYNAGVITIAAESGQTPELGPVLIRSSANWTISGLRISPELGPDYQTDTLINLESHSWQGPVHDITVQDCIAYSVADTSGWSAEDWDALACNGIEVDGRDMTVRDNVLRNVNFGISVSASDSLVEGNLVENFSGDGMRGLGDHTVFQYNTVKNCYAVNQNHDDGFQSWSLGADGQVGTGEVTGIVLRGNTIINYEDPDQPHRGTLQGIGCFDGTFVDWVVENNLVVTDHWHGITLSGARDSRIVNNTVIDLNDEEPGPPWVRIGAHKNGTPSQGCLIRNNLTTDISVDEGQDVTEDHNLIIEDPSALFVDAAAGDFHLLAGCAAVDTGSGDLAPALDLEGVPRPQGDNVDIGAYEYHSGPVESGLDAGVDAGSRPDAGGGKDAAARPGERPDGGAGQIGSGGSGGASGGGAVAGGANGAGIQDSTDNAAGQSAGDGDDGCGCRVRGGRRSPGAGWLALGLLAALVWRRRQGGRKGS